MLTIKKIALLVMLCIALVGGCESKDSKSSNISADRIIILYGVCSKAIEITNDKDILQMVKIYNNSQLKLVDNSMDPIEFYTILYYRNDKMVAKLNIDRNGFVQIDDDNKTYQIKRANSIYKTINKLYNQ